MHVCTCDAKATGRNWPVAIIVARAILALIVIICARGWNIKELSRVWLCFRRALVTAKLPAHRDRIITPREKTIGEVSEEFPQIIPLPFRQPTELLVQAVVRNDSGTIKSEVPLNSTGEYTRADCICFDRAS